jgi:hypothetical protein
MILPKEVRLEVVALVRSSCTGGSILTPIRSLPPLPRPNLRVPL